MDAVDGFIKSVCPNLDIAMRKLTTWLSAGDSLHVPSLLASQSEDSSTTRPLVA